MEEEREEEEEEEKSIAISKVTITENFPNYEQGIQTLQRSLEASKITYTEGTREDKEHRKAFKNVHKNTKTVKFYKILDVELEIQKIREKKTGRKRKRKR